MLVHEGLEALDCLCPGSILSIGNFDGLHLGHHKILKTMRSLRSTMPQSPPLAVITFEPHPLTVLRPRLAPPRLTAPAIKRRMLEAAGVQDLVILPPTAQVLGLTAEQFWQILRDRVRPSHIVEGLSFNFGKNRGGTIQKLRQWAQSSGVAVHTVDAVMVPLLDLHVVQVSSTLIRWLISYGRVRDAAICLGRPYALYGNVIRGFGRGRQIGIPTANLDCGDQLVPGDGVYAARCEIDRTFYPAALSIGTMPTFGENRRQVEVHLIGFDGDLYGRTLEIDIIDWLREQIRFDGVQHLQAQMATDLARVRSIWRMVPQQVIAGAAIA